MKKCIYLKKTEPEVTFKSEEHIIPAGIGGITKLCNGMVSDQFNTGIFSLIELDFMRNSIIAIPRQFSGPGKRGSLAESKATKSQVHIMSETGDFSDASLGFIKLARPYLIPQFKVIDDDQLNIIFDQSDGNYDVQLCRFIGELKKYDGKHNKLVDERIPSNQFLFGNFQGKWYIGLHDKETNVPLEKYISHLINNESIMNEQPKLGTGQVTCHQRTEFNMDNYFRVCAKIIFNFLAFTHGSDFVLQEKFDLIREWIVSNGENTFVNLVDKSNENGEMFKGIPFPDEAHIIMVSKVKNCLIGVISFYGGHFETIVKLCDNYQEDYLIEGYICDWMNRKEYTLTEYINLFTSEYRN